MVALAWICVTLMVASAMRSEALPFASDFEKQALISILLQSPPVAEAACFVKDVNSAEIILNKSCDCGGITVACDIGPVKIGDIEVTFCNKLPNQPLNNLLLMKYACPASDPSCGKGKSCHLGPIEYNNENYYLCTKKTGILPSPSGVSVCRPAAKETERQPPDANSGPQSPDTKLDQMPDVLADKWLSKPTERPWNPPIRVRKPTKTPVSRARPVQTQPIVGDNWPPMTIDDDSWWNTGKTFKDPLPSYNEGGPGVHVYERRRWRVGNKGGEVVKGERPSRWYRDEDSSSEED